MLLNYIKVTLRNLVKEKIYSLINIVGLAIGFACFSLIFIYIRNEKSYDTFNKNGARVFRVVGVLNEAGLGEYHNAVTPGPLGPAVIAGVPGVESAVRLMWTGSAFVSKGEKGFYEEDIKYADPAVFDVLSLRLKEGDPAKALKDPHSLVIDEEIAAKYFGSEDPLGKQLKIATISEAEVYTITGVTEKYPKNSHVSLSMLISFSTVEPERAFLKIWGTNSLTTYLLLKDPAMKTNVEKDILALVYRNLQYDKGSKRSYYLQPLADIHLYSSHILYQSNQNQGNANMLRMFTAIGIFVLLVASINYMNLATARSAKRAREVGVRKVLGSGKKDLISRFIGESTVTAVLAFLLSLALVEMVYPGFKSFMGNRLAVDDHHNASFILELAGIALVLGILSGTYPAFVLSSYQPSQMLRGAFLRGKSGSLLRKWLVIVQFSIAIVLLICTGIVRDQMQYIRVKDIGFERSQLLYVPLRSGEARSKYLVMKDELLRDASVLAVSGGGGIAGASGSDGTMTVAGTNKQVRTMMRFSPVDYDFFSTMGIAVVQGRDFSKNIISDSASGAIVNEAAARELGWKDVVGKQFENNNGPPINVIGMIKDYHFYSLYVKIEPQILYIGRNDITHMLVRLHPGDVEQGIAAIRKIWNQQLPGQPFDYGFVDETFDRAYRADLRTQQLFTVFSGIAIVVGCLGLLGLSVFTAEQRTKEIGIRKVLGASVASIAIKLSTEFVQLVAFSCLIAFPAAWWAMQEWLQSFAYRTPVSPVTFLIAGVVVVLIALATVSIQSVKVAMGNPVESLRYE